MRQRGGGNLRVLDPHLPLSVAAKLLFKSGRIPPPLRSLSLIKRNDPASEILPEECEFALQLAPTFPLRQPLDSVSQLSHGNRRDRAFRFVEIQPGNHGGIGLRLYRFADKTAVMVAVMSVGTSYTGSSSIGSGGVRVRSGHRDAAQPDAVDGWDRRWAFHHSVMGFNPK